VQFGRRHRFRRKLSGSSVTLVPLYHNPFVISLGAGDWILGRPSECLDERSVRTLKNKFKSAGRSLNDVLKYTVGGSDVLATRVETSVPRRGIIT